MADTIKATFTVKQVLELASLCHQFKHYPAINDCYQILFAATMEQAPPGAIKAEADALPNADYFPEFIEG